MEDNVNNVTATAGAFEGSAVGRVTEMVGASEGSAVDRVTEMVGVATGQPTEVERGRQERLAVLRGLRVGSCTVVQPERPSLSVDGVGFFALDDVHAIKAKAKQGKTTVLKVCLAAWLSGGQFRVKSELESPVVLWLDTEQKLSDVKLIIDDVRRMVGVSDEYLDSHLFLYGMRKRDFSELLDDLRLLVGEVGPQVVVVDGVVEFVRSFNDEGEAKQLIHELLCLAEECHCAVVNVLHTNKADEDHNMRGHLGTMLAQKAGTVLECKKMDGTIGVYCSDARHEEMPSWNVMFGDDGRIVDADEKRQQLLEQRRVELQQRRQEANAAKQKERLDYALLAIRDQGGVISRRQLTEILIKKFDLKRTTVTTFISRYVGSVLIESGGNIQAAPDMAAAF